MIVFHYGDTAEKIKDIFYTRDIALKEIELEDSQISNDEEEEEEELDEVEED